MGKNSRKKEPKVRDVSRDVFVARPFEGLADEAEWVALRELVPAATTPLRLTPEFEAKYGAHEVTLATVLPMAWAALTKPDGRVFLGLQRNDRSGDVNRDVAAALVKALESEPGQSIAMPALPGPGPRLADVIVNQPLEITMHSGFDFWLDADQERDDNISASLEAANASIFPTEKLSAAPAAYWCRVPGKSHVRWVMPEPENQVLNALARLAAASELKLGEQTKFAGMFRAHSLLVPVWDLPEQAPAQEWEQPVADFAVRYKAALRDDPLTPEERRAKQGLLARQLSIR